MTPHNPSPFKLLKKNSLLPYLVAYTLFTCSSSIEATPLLNQQDPAIIHTVYGTDKFYKNLKRSRLTFHVSPYFQHTSSASKGSSVKATGSKKVPTGNMEGPWNMAAIFFNENPTTIQRTRLVNFNAAKNALQTAEVRAAADKILTNEATFDLEHGKHDAVVTYHEVGITYEKLGIRSQLSFDLGFGLGIAVKGGIADYKQIPKFTLNPSLAAGLKGTSESGGEDEVQTTPAAPFGGDTHKTAPKRVFEALMSKQARSTIAKELELNLSEQRNTDLEDLHVSAYWSLPFKLEEKGEHVLSVVPHFSIGAWLPIGQTLDQDKAFAVTVGNDGYAAVTAEGSISLDFPELFQLSIGGGTAFYTSRDIANYRVPTSIHQVGIIPWKTSVNRHPGPMWYANLSMKAENFSPGFSGYFDFIYTEHTRDTITIKEPSVTRKNLFKPEILEERSAWKSQQGTLGLQYNLTKHCALGFAVQGTIGGMRTYRTTTVLGSLIALF